MQKIHDYGDVRVVVDDDIKKEMRKILGASADKHIKKFSNDIVDFERKKNKGKK